jgi:hypothetical protein
MRNPEDSRAMDTPSAACDWFNALWAFNELTFVLMIEAMVFHSNKGWFQNPALLPISTPEARSRRYATTDAMTGATKNTPIACRTANPDG